MAACGMPPRHPISLFSKRISENDQPGSGSSRRPGKGQKHGLLVGASDHRRMGDLLRPHVYQALTQFDKLSCLGLVSKDLSPIGGHCVKNYGEAVWDVSESEEMCLVHMGGSSMLSGLVSSFHQAVEGGDHGQFTTIVQMAARDEMEKYVRRRSGQTASLAYVLSAEGCYAGAESVFFGVRLPEPSILEEEQEEHLVFCLGEAAFAGVSGSRAESFFSNRGIAVQQMPCELVAIQALCSEQIEAGRESLCYDKVVSQASTTQGWMLLEVGDIPESMIAPVAKAAQEMAAAQGLSIVLCSAKGIGEGAVYTQQQWQSALPDGIWADNNSLWPLVALVSDAELTLSGCLDTRILASSCGKAAINLPCLDRRVTDYCDVWETSPATLSENTSKWSQELTHLLATPTANLEATQVQNLDAFFHAFAAATDKSSVCASQAAEEKISAQTAAGNSRSSKPESGEKHASGSASAELSS